MAVLLSALLETGSRRRPVPPFRALVPEVGEVEVTAVLERVAVWKSLDGSGVARFTLVTVEPEQLIYAEAQQVARVTGHGRVTPFNRPHDYTEQRRLRELQRQLEEYQEQVRRLEQELAERDRRAHVERIAYEEVLLQVSSDHEELLGSLEALSGRLTAVFAT